MLAFFDVGSEEAVEGPDFWLKKSHTCQAREVQEPEKRNMTNLEKKGERWKGRGGAARRPRRRAQPGCSTRRLSRMSNATCRRLRLPCRFRTTARNFCFIFRAIAPRAHPEKKSNLSYSTVNTTQHKAAGRHQYKKYVVCRPRFIFFCKKKMQGDGRHGC